MLTRPERNEYGDWYVDYVARVPEGNVLDVLEKQSKEMLAFLKTLSEEQAEQAARARQVECEAGDRTPLRW